jgi:hypothetical protein
MHRFRVRFSPSLIVSVIAVVVAVGGVALAAGSTSTKVIHSCKNKQTGALRIATKCSKHERSVISWNKAGQVGPQGIQGQTGPAGPGAKTIGGTVNSDGTVRNGSGFTTSRTGAGTYTISFSAGTWTASATTGPTMTVTPLGANGGVVSVPIVASENAASDGSATFTIVLSSTVGGPATPHDNAFKFIAVQEQ